MWNGTGISNWNLPSSNVQLYNISFQLNQFYYGAADRFSSVFGVSNYLFGGSPSESIRIWTGTNNGVDKSSLGYNLGQGAGDAGWVALGSQFVGPIVSEANSSLSWVKSFANADIPLIGNTILNVKFDKKSFNIINTSSNFRFEIGYHDFGVPNTLFHIKLNATHYFPWWGWPPYRTYP
jgi:hypothetical protein